MSILLKDIFTFTRSRFMYKRIYNIGIAAYLFMLVLSVIFYKERILFLDAAFNLFHIIKEGTFCIQVYRFGDALMQVLPLLAFKAGWSLNTIIKCFSISPVLIYFISYLLCGSILKQYRFAIVILLLNVLFSADTFYWPISQVPQGMAMLILVAALINGSQIKPFQWFVVFSLLILLAFFHPLMAIVMLYTAVFFMLRKDHVLQRQPLVIIFFFFFICLGVKMIFFNATYDRWSMSGLKNFIRLFPDYFTLYSNKQFLKNCITKYYWIPIIALSIIVHYYCRKQWKSLFFFAGTLLGYLLLINVSYPSADTPGFYIENLYLPLGLFLALPFLFDIVPVLEQRKLAFPILVLIIITGCIRLYTTHDVYTARLNYERKFLRDYGDKKIIVAAKNADASVLQMLWGTSYEFLLLSSAEHGRAASIVIDEDPYRYTGADLQRKCLVVDWGLFPYNTLNHTYFHFTDTTSAYIVDPLLPQITNGR